MFMTKNDWFVRSVPAELRHRIRHEAAARDITIADYLARLVRLQDVLTASGLRAALIEAGLPPERKVP